VLLLLLLLLLLVLLVLLLLLLLVLLLQLLLLLLLLLALLVLVLVLVLLLLLLLLPSHLLLSAPHLQTCPIPQFSKMFWKIFEFFFEILGACAAFLPLWEGSGMLRGGLDPTSPHTIWEC